MYVIARGFPTGSVVKNTPAVQETRVQSRGWQDVLEKEMATHSSILAWKISWMENLMDGELEATVHGVTKSRTRLE